MIADALTKQDPDCQSLWELSTQGQWRIQGRVHIRRTAKAPDYEESDLKRMRFEE